jgi:hypothetical protein
MAERGPGSKTFSINVISEFPLGEPKPTVQLYKLVFSTGPGTGIAQINLTPVMSEIRSDTAQFKYNKSDLGSAGIYFIIAEIRYKSSRDGLSKSGVTYDCFEVIV